MGVWDPQVNVGARHQSQWPQDPSVRELWLGARRRLQAAPRGTGWGPVAGPGWRSRGVGVPPPGAGSGIRRRAGGGAGVGRGGRGALPGAARPVSCAVRLSACRHCRSLRVSGPASGGRARAVWRPSLRYAKPRGLSSTTRGAGAGRSGIAGLRAPGLRKDSAPSSGRLRCPQHSSETAGNPGSPS